MTDGDSETRSGSAGFGVFVKFNAMREVYESGVAQIHCLGATPAGTEASQKMRVVGDSSAIVLRRLATEAGPPGA
jgi:hypothetical protein